MKFSKWLYNFFGFKNPYFIIALYLTLFPISVWLNNQALNIVDCDSILPGIATFLGVDVGKRVAIFYKSVFFIIISVSFWSFVFYGLNKKWNHLKTIFIPWSVLSIVGLFFLFFQLINSPQHSSERFLFIIMGTLLMFQFAKYIFKTRLLINTGVSFLWLSVMSFSLTYPLREGLIVLFNISSFSFLLIYFFCFAGVLILMIVLSKITSISFRTVFIFSLPVVLFPLISFFSDELYLILNQRNIHILSPSWWYLIILVLLILLFVVYLEKLKRKAINIKRYLSIFVIPVTIINIIVFSYYFPFISQPTEMFELANPANAIMRIFEHGQIPIIEHLNSHMLSEIFFKFIYVLVNGFDGSLSFLIYDFFEKIVFFLLIYVFLNRFFRQPLFSFFVVLFFPFVNLMVLNDHSLAFVSIFLLYFCFDNCSFKKMLFLWLWNIFLLTWKVDLGFSASMASFLLISLYTLVNRNKQAIIDMLKVLGIIAFSGLIVGSLIHFTCDINLWDNLLKAKEYFGAAQAHGYADIASQDNRYYQYIYFIFPIAATLILVYFIARQFDSQNRLNSFYTVAIIFLLVYYLSNAQRGLIRHSLLEGQDMFMNSFFYLAVSLFLCLFFIKKEYAKYIFIVVFLFLVNNFKFKGTDGYINLYEKFSNNYYHQDVIVSCDKRIKRVKESCSFAEKEYMNIKHFLDDHFDSTQTFIDFSLSPMLYFYTGRQVPSYFDQYMQNLVTADLQQKNIAYLDNYDVPVTLFSNVPLNWFDKTDRVPNTIRYFIICQYIYKHYKPLTILDGRYIWIKEGIKTGIDDSLVVEQSFITEPRSYDLMYYPFFLAKTEILEKAVPIHKEILTNGLGLMEQEERFNNYLLLKVKNDHNSKKKLAVSYAAEEKYLGTYSFFVKAGEHEYFIPVSAQYNWVIEGHKRLTLNFDQARKVSVKQAELYKSIIKE